MASRLNDLHDLRSRSTKFLVQAGITGEPDFEALAGELVEHLTGFFSTGAKHEAILKDATEIITEAAKIDLTFRTSKAQYSVFFSPTPPHQSQYFGYDFDRSKMEHNDHVGPDVTWDRPTVEFAVSPGVMRTGNEAGRYYQKERVFLPLMVVCNMELTLKLCAEAQRAVEEEKRGDGETQEEGNKGNSNDDQKLQTDEKDDGKPNEEMERD